MAADLDVAQVWRERVPVAEATRGTVRRKLSADEPTRQRIARIVGLDALNRLDADITVSPWLDGVQVEGKWTAEVVQTCGVTLDPFESALAGQIYVRALPQGSAALGGTDEHEIELDPDADDPPDVLEGDQIELGAYVVEDLSLAVDPFPRKPGATFEAPEQKGEPSPFAVLAKLKGRAPDA